MPTIAFKDRAQLQHHLWFVYTLFQADSQAATVAGMAFALIEGNDLVDD